MNKFNELYKKIIAESTILNESEDKADLQDLLATLKQKLDDCTDWTQVWDAYKNFFKKNFVKSNGLKIDVHAYDEGFGMIQDKMKDLKPEPDEFFLSNIVPKWNEFHSFEELAFGTRNWRISDKEAKNAFYEKLKEFFMPQFDACETVAEKKNLFNELVKKYGGVNCAIAEDLAAWLVESFGKSDEPGTMKWAETVDITDDIRKEYFINYGFMNGWNKLDAYQYKVASILHDRDKLNNPDLHKKGSPLEYGRCVSSSSCACGFAYSVDSSD